MKVYRNLPYTIASIAVALSILLVWEIVSATGTIPERIFPSASDVLISFWSQIVNGSLGIEFAATLTRLLEGYLIAAAVGISLGIIVGLNHFVDAAVNPIVQFLRPMPSIAVIPLVIIYFGLGNVDVVLPVIFACVWPILINTMDGVRSIDPLILETADEFKLKGIRRIKKIIIPASSPYILSGMRVSIAFAWIVAITVEFVSATVHPGIGVSIFFDLNAGNITKMYGAIISVAIASYAINKLFLFAESRALPWHGRLSRGLDATI